VVVREEGIQHTQNRAGHTAYGRTQNTHSTHPGIDYRQAAVWMHAVRVGHGNEVRSKEGAYLQVADGAVLEQLQRHCGKPVVREVVVGPLEGLARRGRGGIGHAT